MYEIDCSELPPEFYEPILQECEDFVERRELNGVDVIKSAQVVVINGDSRDKLYGELIATVRSKLEDLKKEKKELLTEQEYQTIQDKVKTYNL